MIAPTEIKKKALKKYKDFLVATLRKETFFPLEISGNKGSSKMKMEELFPAMKLLLSKAKDKLGYGYEVELKEINTRHAGRRSMPRKIYFSTQKDYLKYIGKLEEFDQFLKQVVFTQKEQPSLLAFVEQDPLKLIANLEVWPDLIKVIQYFLDNPIPNVYLRALPIAIHTKFIEQHKNIVSELLNFALPPESIQQEEKHFERRYGLRYDEPVIRLRTLDQPFESMPDFINDIALPVSQVKLLRVKSNCVYIVENKQTFLAFPKQKDSFIIWGKGFAIELLKNIPWLQDKTIYFWGDLDFHGFQMLHQLRTYFPQTHSLLMDVKTYEAFEQYAVPTNQKLVMPDFYSLMDAEKACLAFLLGRDKDRLEQEHVSQVWLEQALLDR